ncbi:MAG TPA: glycosyltransferase, partial [Usitatibacter sp.]|nr:glycosyltransferase [Usitatibacter sp.]
MGEGARVTVAIPSLNQGRYLAKALESAFAQGVAVEVYVADAGSTDETADVIRKWEGRLLGWRSHPDAGQ